MPPRVHDVIVVGSGPTGGYAAKALSEAGMRVLVLDAGPPRRSSQALFVYDAIRRRLGYRIEEDPAAVLRQPIQSSCYAWPRHPHAFVDDLENPYTNGPGRRFTWLRSRQVGGRMMVRGHGLQFYRFSDLDFKAGQRDGASPSWPISYADLAPYYERIERWMALRGSADSLAHLPDSVLAGEVPLNAGERLLQNAIAGKWKDRRVIPGRTASPPFPIADALATGRCTLRSNSIASHLTVDSRTAKVNGVAFVDRVSRRACEASARVVILCASSMESARLLLASATRQHPDGLANSSGTVGRYLLDHTHVTGINADIPLAGPAGPGERSWAYIPCFRNIGNRRAEFVRGYGVQVFTLGRQCALTVFGEMLPHPDNRVTLDPRQTDAWGIPVVRVTCVHRENERAMLADQLDACREMLEVARFKPWRFATGFSPPGIANHEVGTARMGTDPATSVLSSFCQSWDVKNLFVMDGSCFVSQGVQNPTLTMLAITARSCDYLIGAFRDL
jgi:choline dehydrogenase-like flavoprotein